MTRFKRLTPALALLLSLPAGMQPVRAQEAPVAKAAATTAQRRRWAARKNGMQDQEEPSEVRNLTHDAEARAQAEAAMRLMAAAKPRGKPRGRW